MSHFIPDAPGLREHFAEVQQQIEESQRRYERERTTLIVEETYQLAMFDEPDELVHKVVVGVERR